MHLEITMFMSIIYTLGSIQLISNIVYIKCFTRSLNGQQVMLTYDNRKRYKILILNLVCADSLSLLINIIRVFIISPLYVIHEPDVPIILQSIKNYYDSCRLYIESFTMVLIAWD